jgi:hypothetical protein
VWFTGHGTHRSGYGSRSTGLKKVVRVDLSRQQIVKTLHRFGMHEIADTAEATLPDLVDDAAADQFCTAHGLSKSIMMDRTCASLICRRSPAHSTRSPRTRPTQAQPDDGPLTDALPACCGN